MNRERVTATIATLLLVGFWALGFHWPILNHLLAAGFIISAIWMIWGIVTENEAVDRDAEMFDAPNYNLPSEQTIKKAKELIYAAEEKHRRECETGVDNSAGMM